MWHRVLSPNRIAPSIAALCDHLHGQNLPVVPSVKADDLGWTECLLNLNETVVGLARYLTAEDDLREDLNSYAAELESYQEIQPQASQLMEKVIQTQQLITLRRPLGHANEAEMDQLCRATVFFLARETNALVQIDGEGWFDANGERLVQEY